MDLVASRTVRAMMAAVAVVPGALVGFGSRLCRFCSPLLPAAA